MSALDWVGSMWPVLSALPCGVHVSVCCDKGIMSLSRCRVCVGGCWLAVMLHCARRLSVTLLELCVSVAWHLCVPCWWYTCVHICTHRCVCWGQLSVTLACRSGLYSVTHDGSSKGLGSGLVTAVRPGRVAGPSVSPRVRGAGDPTAVCK